MRFNAGKFNTPPIEAEFEYNDETIQLTINAGMMNREFFAGILEFNQRLNKKKEPSDESNSLAFLEQSVEGIDLMAETLARLIVKWNVETDDQTPVPVSADFLRNLPLPAINALFNFVTTVNSPKAPTAETFDAGSSAVVQ